MTNKKPIPLSMVALTPRRKCPVCGQSSYSREGIHPQCAQQQADTKRMDRIKIAKAAAKPKASEPNPLAVSPWHKRCPKCKAEVHIRKMTCECGQKFGGAK
jgi:hypothetical protein